MHELTHYAHFHFLPSVPQIKYECAGAMQRQMCIVPKRTLIPCCHSWLRRMKRNVQLLMCDLHS